MSSAKEVARFCGSLIDIEIQKTVEMGVGMLDELIDSGRVASESGRGCGFKDQELASARAVLAKSCDGRVWSARISATKSVVAPSAGGRSVGDAFRAHRGQEYFSPRPACPQLVPSKLGLRTAFRVKSGHLESPS